jgi:hypothetical protein
MRNSSKLFIGVLIICAMLVGSYFYLLEYSHQTSSTDTAVLPASVLNEQSKVEQAASTTNALQSLLPAHLPMLKTFENSSRASRVKELQEFEKVRGDYFLAAELARTQNNLLARHFANLMQNQVPEAALDALPENMREEVKRGQVPAPLKRDASYWLGLAADRGDKLSQLDFAMTVFTKRTLAADEGDAAMQDDVRRAQQYLENLVRENAYADAFVLLAHAYEAGALGLQKDPIRAHACLLSLTKRHPSAETKQLVQISSAKLRVGEVSQAQQMALDGRFLCAD